MVGSLYRHNLKFVGGGRYSLTLRCAGWIDRVESVGFSTTERAVLDKGTQMLTLEVAPRAGQPREVIFSVRPMGAPVWVAGRRDGRPLSPADVVMAEQGVHPSQVPFKLPEVESESERADNMLAPPATASPGVHVWLTLLPGTVKLDIDPQRQEELCALGYIKCPGK